MGWPSLLGQFSIGNVANRREKEMDVELEAARFYVLTETGYSNRYVSQLSLAALEHTVF